MTLCNSGVGKLKSLDESERYAGVGRKILKIKTEYYFRENLSTHHGFNENIPYRKDKKYLSSEKQDLQ